jgi:endoglucanase
VSGRCWLGSARADAARRPMLLFAKAAIALYYLVMANSSLALNTRLATAAVALAAILGSVAAMAVGTDLFDRHDAASPGGPPRPSPTPSADPSTTLSDLPTPGPTGSPDAGVTSAPATRVPTARTLGPTRPRTQAPASDPTRPTTRTPRPSPASGLTASWSLDSSWGTAYVAQIVVTASSPRQGWTVSWADPGATSVSLDWGVTCQVGYGRVTCHGAGWGRSLVAGQSVEVGARVQHRGAPPVRPALRLS